MNLGIGPDLPIMQCMGALFMELPDPMEVQLIILSTPRDWEKKSLVKIVVVSKKAGINLWRTTLL
jgi:hypothetical protein